MLHHEWNNSAGFGGPRLVLSPRPPSGATPFLRTFGQPIRSFLSARNHAQLSILVDAFCRKFPSNNQFSAEFQWIVPFCFLRSNAWSEKFGKQTHHLTHNSNSTALVQQSSSDTTLPHSQQWLWHSEAQPEPKQLPLLPEPQRPNETLRRK